MLDLILGRHYLSGIPPTKGALRNVNNAGRDAVDAGNASDEGVFLRTEKSCGPGTPTLVSSLREGAQATVANKPGAPGRARNNP